MNIKQRLIFTAVFMFALLPLIFVSPAAAAFNLFGQACDPNNSDSNNPACQQAAGQSGSNADNPISGPHGIIQEAANIFALVAVVAALILIVYSGFVFVTAGGTRAGDNSSRARNARSTLTSAITGLIIVALAWTIVTYINTRIIH